MKIQIFGTAAGEGWPAFFCQCTHCQRARELGGKNIRTRSGALINDHYKIDFGPDTFHHVLTHGLNLSKIQHLIFTHSHPDHLAPYDVMRRFPPYAHLKDDDPETLHVWGNDTVIQKITEAAGSRFDRSNRIQLHRLEAYTPVSIGDLIVTPLKADHARNEECFIYTIESEGKTMLYGHDTGVFPEETWDYLTGVSVNKSTGAPKNPIRLDLVILDCTYGQLENTRNHMGVDACFEVQERLIKAGCADKKTHFVATHFSHNGGLLHEELEDVFTPKNFTVAYDGIKLTV